MLTVEYSNGAKYSGSWNDEGEKNGYGELIFPDGSQYKGSFSNGMFCGLGILLNADGSVYEGEFLKGNFNGHGIFTRKDKMVYQGQFNDGVPQGYGMITFPDGTHGLPRQEGYFKNFQLQYQQRSQQHLEMAIAASKKARIQVRNR